MVKRNRWSLVGCVLIVALLEFGRGGREREECKDMVNDVVLYSKISVYRSINV
jgi:hypothetical protein